MYRIDPPHRQLSNASENGTAVTQKSVPETIGHRRSVSTGSHNLDMLDPNQNHKVLGSARQNSEHY